jgi:phosphoglucomutase
VRELHAGPTQAVTASKLAGEPITGKLNQRSEQQRLDRRPESNSHERLVRRTEGIYKIYAESFKDRAHLDAILVEAQEIVDNALTMKS